MSDYMKTMRQYVGHRPILQCGASVIVENEAGEILLELRRDNGCWGYAGGAVELDERVEDAAKRELFEETGLIVDELELFGVFSGPELHYIYPNGDEVSNIDHVYLCRHYSGVPKADGTEIIEVQFFSLDKIPENISPPIVSIIQQYVAKRKKNLI